MRAGQALVASAFYITMSKQVPGCIQECLYNGSSPMPTWFPGLQLSPIWCWCLIVPVLGGAHNAWWWDEACTLIPASYGGQIKYQIQKKDHYLVGYDIGATGAYLVVVYMGFECWWVGYFAEQRLGWGNLMCIHKRDLLPGLPRYEAGSPLIERFWEGEDLPFFLVSATGA